MVASFCVSTLPAEQRVLLNEKQGNSRIKGVMKTQARLAGAMLPAVFLAGAMSFAAPQTTPSAVPVSPAQPSARKSPVVGKPSHYGANQIPKSAEQYYSLMWGVDSFSLKSVEAGEIIRFSYRVLDPAKAKVLNEKKSQPALIDREAGVSLVVPQLEKVGQLRQSGTPEAGKVYWMAFSNKGGRVKPGHKVSVVIGTFRADGLTVF